MLTGASQVTVNISSDGTPNPGSVTFTYHLQATTPPATAQITVNYLDQDNKLLASETSAQA